jgi:thymidylate synthase
MKRKPGAGTSLRDDAYEAFEAVDYQHHPAIKAPVAV